MSAAKEPMPEPFLVRVAEQFKALSDPMRLALLNALFEGEKSVGQLAEEVGSSFANASKHLSVLHAAGWITRSRDGTTVLCALADERTAALCEMMCARVRERAAKEGELAAATAGPSPAMRRGKSRAR